MALKMSFKDRITMWRWSRRDWRKEALSDPASFYASYGEPSTLKEATRFHLELLKQFRRDGLVRPLAEVTGLPFGWWSNFIREDKPRYWPRDEDNQWVVDIHRPRRYTWENRQVSCWNPNSEWMNQYHVWYGESLRISIFRGREKEEFIVSVTFSPNRVLTIRGEEVTFHGELPEAPIERREKVRYALIQAMANPELCSELKEKRRAEQTEAQEATATA